MSEELVYTSAQEGLNRGSHGFCTVISTPGVSKSLADRLESFSGYRHHFPPHDPKANLNPVNYFHHVISVGGERFNILSRVCNAGLDYTQRSNKLAHHIALQHNDLVNCGPAAVQLAAGFHDETFDGTPRQIANGRVPTDVPTPLRTCEAWNRLAGDAGWAGVLAESFLESRDQYVSVIFPVGSNVLPLVNEAMLLIPPERRWEVTYSTYVTRLPAGVDCHWRFYIADSKEAKQLKNQRHSTVIDLTDSPGTAEGGDLVEAARSGVLATPSSPAPVETPPRPAPAKQEPEQTTTTQADLPKATAPASAVPQPPSVPITINKQTAAPPPPNVSTNYPSPVSTPTQPSSAPDFTSPTSRPLTVYAITITALLLLIIVGIVVTTARQPNVDATVASNTTDQDTVPTAQAPEPQVDDAEEFLRNQDAARQKAEAEAKQLENGTRPTQAPPTSPSKKSPSKEPVVQKEKSKPAKPGRDPLEDIKRKGKFLKLPKWNATNLLGSTASRPLADLYCDSVDAVELSLIVGVKDTGNREFAIRKLSKPSDTTRTWQIFRATKQAGNTATELNPTNSKPIATITLQPQTSPANDSPKQSLVFEWAKDIPNEVPSVLRLMELKITITGHSSVTCSLSSPTVLPEIQVVFEKKPELAPPLPTIATRAMAAQPKNTFMDLRIEGFNPKVKVVRTAAGT
ncbi:MAG: hypothetical protein VYE64_09860, partial [Planctomycetota bacterium]|nr:hypothetical protein [Planctomycetota bacterium]